MFLTWRNIPILCYHDMGTPQGHSLDLFEKHLQTIIDLGFKTISGHELYKIVTNQKKLDDKYIVLTFDDCHVSNWLFTIPLLKKYKMKGIFFAITDFIWEGKIRTTSDIKSLDKLSNAFRRALNKKDYTQFMNLQEIKATIEDYNMEVYSHSSVHAGCFRCLKQEGTIKDRAHWAVNSIYKNIYPNLPVFPIGSAYAYNGFWPVQNDSLPINSQNTFEINKIKFIQRTDEERYKFCLQDFKRSYQKIKQINKQNLQLFCWPWGHFDNLSLKALKMAGFNGAFSLERFYNGPGTNPFKLHRIGIGRKKDQKWLKTRLLMHTSKIGASIFFKFFRKKKETVL